MQKGMQKQQGTKKQRQAATRHWKVLVLDRVVVTISALQLGQVVEIGSGPAICWLIVFKIFDIVQWKFGNMSLNVRCQSDQYWKWPKWLTGNVFTSFFPALFSHIFLDIFILIRFDKFLLNKIFKKNNLIFRPMLKRLLTKSKKSLKMKTRVLSWKVWTLQT